jgi:iron complex outermembrane receptor protein
MTVYNGAVLFHQRFFMTHVVSARLAATLLLLAGGACASAQQADMPSVLVSGSRFASEPTLPPIGATVITAADIRNAGATDVNQAIRKIGGVFGRQSLDSSPDFALDLRGFGTNSSQNMVIMVDGVRLNENELATAVLSNIQIDTVERIEITRGGSSVLYGDGATGGVIQIITKRGAADGTAAGTHGSVFAEGGQFADKTLRGNLTHSFDRFVFDASYGRNTTDGYRTNSRFDQRTVGAGLVLNFDGGKAGIHIDSARDDSGLPGSLTLDQFNANPRQSATPYDAGTLDTDRYTAFVEQRLGAVELAAELSQRERTVTSHYDYGSDGVSDATYISHQTQFSPRARYVAHPYGLLNEVVGGVDLIRWTRDTTSDFSLANARQMSKAVYLRDELRFDALHDGRLAIGARHETFDKDYVDSVAGATADNHVQTQNAWDLQGSYSIWPQVAVHAKAGQSYRVANADENSYRSSDDLLKGQISHDLELGLTPSPDERNLFRSDYRLWHQHQPRPDPPPGPGNRCADGCDGAPARQCPFPARQCCLYRRPQRRARHGAGAEECAVDAPVVAGRGPVGRHRRAVGRQAALRRRFHECLRGAHWRLHHLRRALRAQVRAVGTGCDGQQPGRPSLLQQRVFVPGRHLPK